MNRQSSDLDEITHLLYFSSRGDVSVVRDILDGGMDVNASDYDGRTALHLAASEGHLEVVQLLLAHGHNLNPVDRWRSTPLSDGQHYGYAEVSRTLKAAGGKVGEGSDRLTTPQPSPVRKQTGEFEIDVSELDFRGSQPAGKGAFGEIRVVSWRGTRVAVKTIVKQLSSQPQVQRDFRDELELLQKLRHPNIVQFLGAVTISEPHMLVTEYLPRGNLHEIVKRKGPLSAAEAVRYALDVARGMTYLHEHKPDPIVHRDLKPRNLLRDEAGHLKVADFGLSRLLKTHATQRIHEIYQLTGETGSYRYMAPEVFRHEAYDKSIDVYAFGIIVHEMFEGGPAFKGENPEVLAEQFATQRLRPEFTMNTYPEGMEQLISECWQDAYRKRPHFITILERLQKMNVPLGGSGDSIALEPSQSLKRRGCRCAII